MFNFRALPNATFFYAKESSQYCFKQLSAQSGIAMFSKSSLAIRIVYIIAYHKLAMFGTCTLMQYCFIIHVHRGLVCVSRDVLRDRTWPLNRHRIFWTRTLELICSCRAFAELHFMFSGSPHFRITFSPVFLK